MNVLDIDYHPGFENGGRRVLAECEEYKLWEIFKPGGELILERSEHVEKAYWETIFGNNDNTSLTTKADRLAWAYALNEFTHFSRSIKDSMPSGTGQLRPLTMDEVFESDKTGSIPVAIRLAATLGKEILSVLEAKDKAQAVESCVGKFKTALNSILRSVDKPIDKRSRSKFSKERLIIIISEDLFYYSRTRPKKSIIRNHLDDSGLGYTGKNSDAQWNEKFRLAGLIKLPD